MMHIPLLYLVLTVIVFSGLVVQSVIGAKAPTGFSVELIHRDSPSSPFYNASLTTSDILIKNALHSMDRLKHFQSLIDENAIQSLVIPTGTSYLMKLSFGTPAVEYFAVADTGSDLIWIQCVPCQCYDQGSSPFDPQASSTYKTIPCVSDSCQTLPQRGCSNKTNDCEYLYTYQDQSFSIGTLSTDTLSFDSSDGQKSSFPTSIFGCGHINQGRFTKPSAGLVGLGGGPLSLVSQISNQIDHRFSYCLVPPSASSGSKMLFGQEAIISRPGAVSTPMITRNPPTLYFLTLEGVSIGDNTKQAGSSQGNTVIDSGTTLTYLEPSLYKSLESMVQSAIGAAGPVQNPPRPFRLCYETGSIYIKKIPEMVFHFNGDADLRLQPRNTFFIIDDLQLLCMLIVPSDVTIPSGKTPISILGNYAQINFQVEYDLQKKTISFAPTDCTKQ